MIPERAKSISLIVTSLVIGLLLMLNLQRRGSWEEIRVDVESSHGWPLVYLLRHPDQMAIGNQTQSDWPWHTAANEVRTFSSMNLVTDIIVCVSIVGVTYMMLNTFLGVWSANREDDSDPEML